MRRTRPSVAAAALLASLAIAPAAHAAFPGRNGYIAYNTSGFTDSGGGEPSRAGYGLRVAAVGHRERFALRTCTRLDAVPQGPNCDTSYDNPAYSRDGEFLVVDAGLQLAILASDGSDFRLLPRQTGDDGEPAWSPDGTRIVFTGGSDSESADRDLYVLNVAKGTSRRLTRHGGRAPVWSSRNRIAYVVGYSDVFGRPPRGQIATIKPDGSGYRQLTRKGGVAPAWSPHATKIAFVRRFRLFVMDANGKLPLRVGRHFVSADDVAWSPNGRLFAVHSFESGFAVMRTDGTHRRQIAEGGSGDDYWFDAYSPDWQPLPRRS